MTAQTGIECHTCGDVVKLAHSVLLRQHLGPSCYEQVPLLTNDGPIMVDAGRVEGLDEDAYPIGPGKISAARVLQAERLMQFRRAFVCLRCYRFLDNGRGSGAISRDGKARMFGLAGASRGGKAAIYNYAKWLRFQAKLEAGMAAEIHEPGNPLG